MVEGAPLLREYTREGIVGSNPIFSAIIPNVRHGRMGTSPELGEFSKQTLQ